MPGYGSDGRFAAIQGDITVVPYTAGGRDKLTAEEASAYLDGSGYIQETGTLMAAARRSPGDCQYTADRHRYLVYVMPGGYWRAGDCAASEDRIKSLKGQHHSRW
jgi:hypothetical protein